jgi:hypothetical protein
MTFKSFQTIYGRRIIPWKVLATILGQTLEVQIKW